MREEHLYALAGITSLAFTRKEQGRKGEVIKLMGECIQLRNQVLGSEHPYTLSSDTLLAKWQNVA